METKIFSPTAACSKLSPSARSTGIKSATKVHRLPLAKHGLHSDSEHHVQYVVYPQRRKLQSNRVAQLEQHVTPTHLPGNINVIHRVKQSKHIQTKSTFSYITKDSLLLPYKCRKNIKDETIVHGGDGDLLEGRTPIISHLLMPLEGALSKQPFDVPAALPSCNKKVNNKRKCIFW